jgi:hypothetical protein
VSSCSIGTAGLFRLAVIWLLDAERSSKRPHCHLPRNRKAGISARTSRWNPIQRGERRNRYT